MIKRTKINQILTEMEDAIVTGLRAAKLDAEEADPNLKVTITDPIIGKFGTRAMEVLDNDQKNRFWQIGAQSAGIGVFENNRTQRVLRLTKDQLQKMGEISQKTAETLRRAAINPDLKIDEIQALVDQEQKKEYDQFLALLSEDQRKALDQLLGKPFDLEALKTAKPKIPRSLTFVFNLTWRNAHALISDPAFQKKIGLTLEQKEKLKPLLAQSDKRVTAVRLGILKGLEVDFSELNHDAKEEVALKICDGVNKLFRETENQVSELLTKDQVAALDRRLVQFIGVRAIGSERIAAQLELTADQKRAFAEAEAEFGRKTAPLRVVRSPKQFDERKEAAFKAPFVTTAKSLLTTSQLEKLESLGREAEQVDGRK